MSNGIQAPLRRTRQCPECGEVATTVTEYRNPEPRMLCDVSSQARDPRSKWRQLEPCGHEVDA